MFLGNLYVHNVNVIKKLLITSFAPYPYSSEKPIITCISGSLTYPEADYGGGETNRMMNLWKFYWRKIIKFLYLLCIQSTYNMYICMQRKFIYKYKCKGGASFDDTVSYHKKHDTLQRYYINFYLLYIFLGHTSCRKSLSSNCIIEI